MAEALVSADLRTAGKHLVPTLKTAAPRGRERHVHKVSACLRRSSLISAPRSAFLTSASARLIVSSPLPPLYVHLASDLLISANCLCTSSRSLRTAKLEV